MALEALGIPPEECSIEQVNRVLGALPLRGASWEQVAGAASHYGCRATLVVPSTLRQVRAWTDAGTPVLIGWNTGNEWSHASLIFHVDDTHVHIADPNIPNPDETVRVISHGDFYEKWWEKSGEGYKVRRPAMAIELEITPDGRQIMARNKIADDADCYKDWKNGGLSWREYQRCLGRESGGGYGYRRPKTPKTPRAPAKPPAVKTVVDSATAEKLNHLEELAKKVRGPDLDVVAQAKALYESGGKPDEDMLKKIRNFMYKSGLKPLADHFRVASKRANITPSLMVGKPKAGIQGEMEKLRYYLLHPNEFRTVSQPQGEEDRETKKRAMSVLKDILKAFEAEDPAGVGAAVNRIPLDYASVITSTIMDYVHKGQKTARNLEDLWWGR